VEGAKKNGIDFSRVQFVSLDEWVGIPKSNNGSCYNFLHETLFEPLRIQDTNIHFFNSTAADLSAECERINQVIQTLGGIDLMLVGIGVNGHIGFNEPGVSPDLFAHVIKLDAITLQVGQKYFSETTALQKGITLGIARFMQSRMAILMATGSKKAAIIKKALKENVSDSVPASFIQQHRNAIVLLDREVAGLLN
jgi:galactosamine-6-phosphate isomerase